MRCFFVLHLGWGPVISRRAGWFNVRLITRWWFQTFFIFTPILGVSWSNLTVRIYFKWVGKNHRLDKFTPWFVFFEGKSWCQPNLPFFLGSMMGNHVHFFYVLRGSNLNKNTKDMEHCRDPIWHVLINLIVFDWSCVASFGWSGGLDHVRMTHGGICWCWC